jgi:hypothetical protein
MLDARPWYRLTAHFFVGLFDFGVLSEAASDAFRRVLIGIVAIILTFGLLVARMYALGAPAAASPERYRLAAAAGEALMIGLPMLVVAFATLLVSHSLFPDETDFRVLLVLPISRRTVFVSKLLALALFVALFIVCSHVAMLPLFLRMSASRWADRFVWRFAAHAVASLAASVFVVLALTAINGALLMTVPRARFQGASMAFRSMMLCALVLSVPFVARLPAVGPLLATESPMLLLAPPVWFLGVEQLLLGEGTPYVTRLADIAAAAFLSCLALAVGSYSFLYQRFDRVMLRPADGTASHARQWLVPGLPHTRRPHFAAITAFTHATIARSPLHQGVFVAVSACGAGLVLNSFIGAEAIPRLQSYEQALVISAIWAPFALTFAMTLAVRAAIVLPIEPRANWVFRMTEDDAGRIEQLNAVVHAMVRLGVVVPLAMLFPVEWAMFGPDAIVCTSVAFMAGRLLVEVEMGDWQRIPFTCSYMPGKRFVGLSALIGFTVMVVFTSVGSGLVWYSVRHRFGWFVVMAIIGAVVLQRRRRRLMQWRHTALIFEDSLPTEIEPLRLSPY